MSDTLRSFGLGLDSQANAIVVVPKINSCQNHLRKKMSRSVKYRLPLAYKKDPLKYLDNLIKLEITTNFDRCAISNILNCLTKNFEP